MSSPIKILLLIARPAAGKSEIIDYLKRSPIEIRKSRFYIGDFVEIDDFPMLWAWFEDDALLEQMGYPRLHTDPEGYFLHQYQWDLLIRRIGLEYQKLLRNPVKPETIIIEFSRGSEHGGYQSAFNHLDKEIVRQMGVLYVDVSYAESLRKNRKRFNPNRPDSILEHALPDKKLEKLYKEIDWDEIERPDPDHLLIQGVRVPYVVFANEDDVTSPRGEELGRRLEAALQKLWDLINQDAQAAGNDK